MRHTLETNNDELAGKDGWLFCLDNRQDITILSDGRLFPRYELEEKNILLSTKDR